jgi:hypothetical protein
MMTTHVSRPLRGKSGSPSKEPALPVLLSQGMTRPGIVHGQHWGQRPYPRPTPASHADPRLSNPVTR